MQGVCLGQIVGSVIISSEWVQRPFARWHARSPHCPHVVNDSRWLPVCVLDTDEPGQTPASVWS